mmetsp:Transcript_31175/g.66337  ORF Transcript_31175/g.66337 Transcript_31175/m.66337 type:complete len:673 (-) Transcript_31175:62-2080(-)
MRRRQAGETPSRVAKALNTKNCNKGPAQDAEYLKATVLRANAASAPTPRDTAIEYLKARLVQEGPGTRSTSSLHTPRTTRRAWAKGNTGDYNDETVPPQVLASQSRPPPCAGDSGPPTGRGSEPRSRRVGGAPPPSRPPTSSGSSSFSPAAAALPRASPGTTSPKSSKSLLRTGSASPLPSRCKGSSQAPAATARLSPTLSRSCSGMLPKSPAASAGRSLHVHGGASAPLQSVRSGGVLPTASPTHTSKAPLSHPWPTTAALPPTTTGIELAGSVETCVSCDMQTAPALLSSPDISAVGVPLGSSGGIQHGGSVGMPPGGSVSVPPSSPCWTSASEMQQAAAISFSPSPVGVAPGGSAPIPPSTPNPTGASRETQQAAQVLFSPSTVDVPSGGSVGVPLGGGKVQQAATLPLLSGSVTAPLGDVASGHPVTTCRTGAPSHTQPTPALHSSPSAVGLPLGDSEEVPLVSSVDVLGGVVCGTRPKKEQCRLDAPRCQATPACHVLLRSQSPLGRRELMASCSTAHEATPPCHMVARSPSPPCSRELTAGSCTIITTSSTARAWASPSAMQPHTKLGSMPSYGSLPAAKLPPEAPPLVASPSTSSSTAVMAPNVWSSSRSKSPARTWVAGEVMVATAATAACGLDAPRLLQTSASCRSLSTQLRPTVSRAGVWNT